MKAWILDQISSIRRIRLAEVPRPRAGRGEAVVRVRFAALNPADRYLAEGQYPARPAFPHILGRDGVGVVEEVGTDVDRGLLGQVRLILRSEVGVNRPGTLAQWVAAPVESLAPMPEPWSMTESAGAALVYLTAFQALTMWGDVRPGVVLISGASGGVGAASIHLAAALGHQVAALSRSEPKRPVLLREGARWAFDPADGGWAGELKSSGRVNLAIDNIGGEGFNDIIGVMAENGRISCVGRLNGPVPLFSTASLLFRRVRIGGVSAGSYTAEQAQQAWNDLVLLMNQAGRRPLVDGVYSLERVPEAFARLESGPLGKVIVSMD